MPRLQAAMREIYLCNSFVKKNPKIETTYKDRRKQQKSKISRFFDSNFIIIVIEIGSVNL